MDNLIAMTAYIGTKLIYARPMTRGAYNEYRGWSIPANENPADEGYLVRYPDGYESWSPKAVFEEAYRPTNAMNFGLAIEAAKKGKKIARAGWNGKGMFLYHVPAAAYPPSTEVAKVAFNGENVPYGAYIAMKTAQGNVVPWLASQTDILADDWYIVE